MSVAFVADVHVANFGRFAGPARAGINERCRLVLETLAGTCRRANQLRCETLVVLGDLFDGVRPEPQVIAGVQAALAQFDGRVFLLVGNHDQVSTSPGDHALGPLAVNDVEVVDQPRVADVPGATLVLLPFSPSDARAYLPHALQTLAPKLGRRDGGVRALCIHAGIEDEQTPAFLRDARDALPLAQVRQLAELHQLGFVLAGNWHRARAWPPRHDGAPRVVQVGALCPTGFSDSGLPDFGSLVVLDDAGRLRREVARGPRFLTISDGDPAPDTGANMVFLRIRATADRAEAARAQLAEWIASKLLVGGEVQVEGDVRSAASAARAVDTIEEAAAAFVGTMPIEPGVDRAEVLARVRSYLGKGAA